MAAHDHCVDSMLLISALSQLDMSPTPSIVKLRLCPNPEYALSANNNVNVCAHACTNQMESHLV